MKLNYSEPKFYTGGVNIKGWSKLTRKQQKEALSKDWYVYFSYRDKDSNKLKRQSPIKGGVNRFKTKNERLMFMKLIKRSLVKFLENGYVPNKDNSQLYVPSKEPAQETTAPETILEKLQEETPKTETQPKPSPTPALPVTVDEKSMSAEEAFDFGLKIKKQTLSPNSYVGYVSPVRQFQKWLNEKEIKDISKINKKTVVEYLNSVLERTSARTRNNARTTLSSIFTTLEDNEIIDDNFILKINVLPTKPERNKTFTPVQESKLETYMTDNDPLLLSFVRFLSLNFLRPIEVCRLKIKDVDVSDKKIYVKAKNKKVKIKIIPEILIDLLPDFSGLESEHYLFTPHQIGGIWDIPEMDKRNYFSKRFKKVKDHFQLGREYGLYSYRHTYITKLYREMRKELSENETKSKLLGITGHNTLIALEKYLRDIDAELPADYSEFLQTSVTDKTQND
ncbi:tyrosine-type recombinase/integrase [Maribacter sp. ACAM166]|uniref:tyrosine-type recombinase/integrase n=1 Tax=Maribacter sp. ACAM166 TaxID=2508996 RepID=UPI002016AB72|nr:site-specific integrase [Maribacter sp. ACAM166]